MAEKNYSTMNLEELEKEKKSLKDQIDDLSIERMDLIIEELSKSVIRRMFFQDRKAYIIWSSILALINTYFAFTSSIGILNFLVVLFQAWGMNVSFKLYKKRYEETAKRAVIEILPTMIEELTRLKVYQQYEAKIEECFIKLNQIERCINNLKELLNPVIVVNNPNRYRYEFDDDELEEEIVKKPS